MTPVLDREVVLVDDVGGDGLTADPEVRVVDAPGAEDLRDDVLDGVRGDGEADTDVAGGGVAGLDLRVDADDLSAAREEGASGVAVVDRRRRSG